MKVNSDDSMGSDEEMLPRANGRCKNNDSKTSSVNFDNLSDTDDGKLFSLATDVQ